MMDSSYSSRFLLLILLFFIHFHFIILQVTDAAAAASNVTSVAAETALADRRRTVISTDGDAGNYWRNYPVGIGSDRQQQHHHLIIMLHWVYLYFKQHYFHFDSLINALCIVCSEQNGHNARCQWPGGRSEWPWRIDVATSRTELAFHVRVAYYILFQCN